MVIKVIKKYIHSFSMNRRVQEFLMEIVMISSSLCILFLRETDAIHQKLNNKSKINSIFILKYK